ncbi:MAG TPA: hypothetical protein VLJ59_06240 [Mycobacteriales bacterium]|nr:hypothetical protein [Mycobacteriales bacterium]
MERHRRGDVPAVEADPPCTVTEQDLAAASGQERGLLVRIAAAETAIGELAGAQVQTAEVAVSRYRDYRDGQGLEPGDAERLARLARLEISDQVAGRYDTTRQDLGARHLGEPTAGDATAATTADRQPELEAAPDDPTDRGGAQPPAGLAGAVGESQRRHTEVAATALERFRAMAAEQAAGASAVDDLVREDEVHTKVLDLADDDRTARGWPQTAPAATAGDADGGRVRWHETLTADEVITRYREYRDLYGFDAEHADRQAQQDTAGRAGWYGVAHQAWTGQPAPATAYDDAVLWQQTYEAVPHRGLDLDAAAAYSPSQPWVRTTAVAVRTGQPAAEPADRSGPALADEDDAAATAAAGRAQVVEPDRGPGGGGQDEPAPAADRAADAVRDRIGGAVAEARSAEDVYDCGAAVDQARRAVARFTETRDRQQAGRERSEQLARWHADDQAAAAERAADRSPVLEYAGLEP